MPNKRDLQSFATQVTKSYWYFLGGFSNPKCFRVSLNGKSFSHWVRK